MHTHTGLGKSIPVWERVWEEGEVDWRGREMGVGGGRGQAVKSEERRRREGGKHLISLII